MIPHPLNRFGFENNVPLTLTAVETGTVELRATGSPNVSGLHYRLGTFGNWLTYVPGTVLTLQAGKKVQFWNSNTALSSSASDYVKFIFSGQIKASGNCASMLNFTNQIPYRGLTNLFRDCTGLLTAPELPTLNVAGYGYTGMFRGCTNLVKGPKILPAMDIAAYCYNSMFQECSSLITAPKLPAMTLKTNCYRQMFYKCTSLSSLQVNFTDWNAEGTATADWLNDVSSTGTFTKPQALEEIRGGSRIPTNWTIINK